MQYAVLELRGFKYQRDCWPLGFAYANGLGMLIWCAIVPCLELTMPSVPSSTERSDLACPLQMSARACTLTHTHTHTHTHSPNPYPSLSRKHLIGFPFQVLISAGNLDESGI